MRIEDFDEMGTTGAAPTRRSSFTVGDITGEKLIDEDGLMYLLNRREGMFKVADPFTETYCSDWIQISGASRQQEVDHCSNFLKKRFVAWPLGVMYIDDLNNDQQTVVGSIREAVEICEQRYAGTTGNEVLARARIYATL